MEKNEQHIDREISEKYGIVNYGKVGMEIIRDGVSVARFKDKPTQLENWLDAVAFAEKPMMYYTSKDLLSGQEIGIGVGTGAFLANAAGWLVRSLTVNPPYNTGLRADPPSALEGEENSDDSAGS